MENLKTVETKDISIWLAIGLFLGMFGLIGLSIYIISQPFGEKVCKFEYQDTDYFVYVSNIEYRNVGNETYQFSTQKRDNNAPDGEVIVTYHVYENWFWKDGVNTITVFSGDTDGLPLTEYAIKRTKERIDSYNQYKKNLKSIKESLKCLDN